MKTTLKAAFLAKYPRYMNILSMYEQANDLTGKEVSDVTFNKTIRVICKNVGIDERVKLYQAGKYIGGEKWIFDSNFLSYGKKILCHKPVSAWCRSLSH